MTYASPLNGEEKRELIFAPPLKGGERTNNDIYLPPQWEEKRELIFASPTKGGEKRKLILPYPA